MQLRPVQDVKPVGEDHLDFSRGHFYALNHFSVFFGSMRALGPKPLGYRMQPTKQTNPLDIIELIKRMQQV